MFNPTDSSKIPETLLLKGYETFTSLNLTLGNKKTYTKTKEVFMVSVEMNMVIWVKILDKTIEISLSTYTLWKSLNPVILPWAMSK